MALELLLLREGTKLGAADAISHDAILGLKHGECVTASIRRPRNPKHHAKLFALLQAVFIHQKTFATVQDLLGALKMAVGLFDTGKTIDGIPYSVPRSISFASMCQTEFEAVYDKMVDVILTRILPGVGKQELTNHVNDILEGTK